MFLVTFTLRISEYSEIVWIALFLLALQAFFIVSVIES